MPETAHEILETLLSDNSLNDDQDLMSRIAPPDLRLSQSLEFLDEVQLESAALYDDFEFDTPKADQEEVTESDVDHDILRRVALSQILTTGGSPNSNAAEPTSNSSKESIERTRCSSDQVDTLLPDSATPAPSKGPLWQKIAARQLQRWQNAERDNAQLRAMLQVQMEEAEKLKRLVKRRTKIELIEDLLGAKRHKTLAPSVTATPDENPQVFQKILRVSDELYVTFEKIFAENGMHSLPCTGHKQTESRNMVGDGVFLEIMHQNFVPFNFRETERVVWVCLSEIGMRSLEGVRDYNKEVSFHAQHLEKDNNTMVTSYFAATTGVPAVSGAQFQKVLRKYIEENRAVFVCQTEMEPKLEGSGASIGVRFYTTLIVVVESGASINGTSDTARLQLHFSAFRRDLGTPISAKFCEPGSLDIGIAAWEAMICRVSDALESFLVDNAVGAFTIE
ncbi:hypothetical protein PC129_g14493 [Phytophthora cactorum]|uniref:Uncharacterized protein n=1 Tax=Phytophthora cactorum TaxID=29920 RepID=A0A8T1HU49_9STRA|nr:hypothetical protein PC129_g14493 [Phytophthora cactorum]